MADWQQPNTNLDKATAPAPPLPSSANYPAVAPPPPPMMKGPPPVQFAIGDIGIAPPVILTPNCTMPLRGSQWIVRDMSVEKTATVGIVLAILFFWVCLLGLLFLFMKETTGYVEVQVQSGGRMHVTQLPVKGKPHVMMVRQQVAQAQPWAMAA